MKHLVEFRPADGEVYEVGQVITVAEFEEGKKLDVTGTSKGKEPGKYQETRTPEVYDTWFKT